MLFNRELAVNHIGFDKSWCNNCMTFNLEHYTVIKKNNVDGRELLENDLQNKPLRGKKVENNIVRYHFAWLYGLKGCMCACVHEHVHTPTCS